MAAPASDAIEKLRSCSREVVRAGELDVTLPVLEISTEYKLGGGKIWISKPACRQKRKQLPWRRMNIQS